MATTKTTEELFSGNGSQTSFPFTIEYLKTSDITVKVSGVLQTETTHYSVVGTNIVFVTAPSTGTNNIRITRVTDIDTARSIYAAGASIRAVDLNSNQDQILFKLQEKETRTPSATVSATAPTDPTSGDTWYDTVSGRSFIYYTDVDTSQWVEENPAFDADEFTTNITNTNIATNAAIDATKLSFTPAGTGAVARTVDSKLEDVVSVKDFGALGDNSNDDTAELQAALNAAAGKTLLMPKGIYLISKTLIIPEGTRIIGSGKADISEEDYTKGTVIKTTGAGTGQVWTDIASGTDATQTPCLVAGGNGVYIENLTVLTAANNWSIGILYPCVKQCSVSKVSMRGFTNACLYLDASRSNLNKPSVTDQAGTSVTINCGTGMNEFYAEDFIFRSNTNGVSDFGIKIQGTTRDTAPAGVSYQTPTDSTTQANVDGASASSPFWVWGWGGASDIVFNSGRTSGISIDGALSTNVAKTIQGQRFIAVDSRVGGSGVLLNIDRAHRVDFVSGYGEATSGTPKVNFTGNTGKCNFVFTDYNGEVFLTPTAWSSSVAYTIGQKVLANSKIYEAQASISSGGSEPSHSSGTTNNWKFIVASGTTLGSFGTTYVNENISVFTERGEFVTANGLLNDNDVLRPVVDGGINLGSSSFNFNNVKAKKVQSDKFTSNQGTELTIASGAITATHSFHTVDTESDAASDDLDTINGGATGQMLLITAENDARTVVAKDGTGNLRLSGDFSLDHSTDSLLLMYVSSYWIEISRSNNA